MMFYQPANNPLQAPVLRSAFLRLSAIVILSFLILSQARADSDDSKKYFCFTRLDESSCQADENTGVGDSYNIVEVGTYQAGYDLTIRNLDFNFRAYKGDDDDDDDKATSRKWELRSTDIRYCGNVSNAGNCTSFSDSGSKLIESSNYIDKINITGPGTDITEEEWQSGRRNAINGGNNHDSPETYYSAELTMVLKKEWLSTLLPGDYKVRVRVLGHSVGMGFRYADLDIILAFNVPDNVAISGLDPVDFGTFPENFTRHIQLVCAHAQAAGGFKITTSNNKGGYVLKGQKNTTETITYSVDFGPDENDMVSIPYGGNGTTGAYFIGHTSIDCSGLTDENMLLGITLTEPFDSLSSKPADSYSDTLTLTISPD